MYAHLQAEYWYDGTITNNFVTSSKVNNTFMVILLVLFCNVNAHASILVGNQNMAHFYLKLQFLIPFTVVFITYDLILLALCRLQ